MGSDRTRRTTVKLSLENAGKKTSKDILKEWMRCGELRKDCEYLLDRLYNEYRIGICTDGTYMIRETRQIIRRNHIKLILRNDYRKKFPGRLTGKALEVALEAFLDSLPKSFKIAEMKGKVSVTQVDFSPVVFDNHHSFSGADVPMEESISL